MCTGSSRPSSRKREWKWTTALPAGSTPRVTRHCTKRCCRGLLANCRHQERGGRLSRDTRPQVLPASGLGVVEEAAPMGARGGTGRDRAAVRALRGRIEPEWIEEVAGERVTREYFDALGRSARRSRRRRTRSALRIDGCSAPDSVVRRQGSDLARAIFIREALVEGSSPRRAHFSRTTHARSPTWRSSSTRRAARTCWSTRRRSLRSTPSAFPKPCIRPPASSAGVEAEQRDPKRLFITREALMRHAAAASEAQYPEILKMAGRNCRSSIASRRGIRSTG